MTASTTIAGTAPNRTTRLPLYALLLAGAISTTGNMLTSVAIPWFVLETTGSAARTGIAGAVTVIPVILSGLFGGAIVDRLGFKRVSILADLASGATVAAIPLLYQTVGLAFWQLLLLAFLGALLDAPGSTARQSMVPEIAALAGQPLERTNALVQIIPRASILFGPPLAGVLIALIGASSVLWVDAATFAVSAGLVALAIPATPRPQSSSEAGPSYMDDLRAGLRYIREQRTIIYLIATFAAANFLLDPLFAVVLPVLARERYGDAVELGIMVAAFGAGTLAGTLGYAALGPRLPRRRTILVSVAIAGLPLWVIATTEELAVILVALFVMGLGIGPISPIVTTAMHERVSVEMRGRVFGAWFAIATATIPLGILVTGLVVETVGIETTLYVLAAAYLGVIASAILNPAIRAIEEPMASASIQEAV